MIASESKVAGVRTLGLKSPWYVMPAIGIRWLVGSLVRQSSRRSGLLALFDQGAVSITAFSTTVILGRVAGKAELGSFTVAWLIVAIATGVLSTLVNAPYTVFSPQMNGPRRQRYLGSLVLHQLFISALLALGVLLFVYAGSSGRWPRLSAVKVPSITAVVLLSFGFKEFARNVSLSDLRAGTALAIDVAACVIQLGGLLLLWQGDRLSAQTTMTVTGISSGVAGAAWVSFNWHAWRVNWPLCRADLNRNWTFAKWVLVSGIVWQCVGYLIPFVLAIFHDTSLAGTWAACTAIVALGNPLVLGLSNYMLPKISHVFATTGILGMRSYVQRCSFICLGLLLPVWILIAMSGERIITLIYGDAYRGTTGTLALLAASTLLTAAARPYAQGLFALDLGKTDALVNVAWVSLLFVVGIPAAKAYGVFGAALTVALTSLIALAIRVPVFARAVRDRS